mgnify:CR=1 FL=1
MPKYVMLSTLGPDGAARLRDDPQRLKAVNAELEEATRKLISIFLAEECRRSRVAALAEQFLAEGRLRSPAPIKPSH